MNPINHAPSPLPPPVVNNVFYPENNSNPPFNQNKPTTHHPFNINNFLTPTPPNNYPIQNPPSNFNYYNPQNTNVSNSNYINPIPSTNNSTPAPIFNNTVQAPPQNFIKNSTGNSFNNPNLSLNSSNFYSPSLINNVP